MRPNREWELEELIACWTPARQRSGRLANKTDATRLRFEFGLTLRLGPATQARGLDVGESALHDVSGQIGV